MLCDVMKRLICLLRHVSVLTRVQRYHMAVSRLVHHFVPGSKYFNICGMCCREMSSESPHFTSGGTMEVKYRHPVSLCLIPTHYRPLRDDNVNPSASNDQKQSSRSVMPFSRDSKTHPSWEGQTNTGLATRRPVFWSVCVPKCKWAILRHVNESLW